MKINLLNFLIKGGSCLLGATALGGTAAEVYLNAQSPEVQVAEPVVVEQEAVAEQEPVAEPIPIEKQQEVSVPQTAPETVVDTPTQVSPINPVEAEPVSTEFGSWHEYVKAYDGVCPSQQPKDSPWWQHYRFSAAAGADTSYGYGLRKVVQTYWEGAKAGRMTGTWVLDNFANLGLSFSSLNSRGALFINLDQMQVHWDGSSPELCPWPYPDHPAEWDTMAAEAQSYLDALNSRYNSRCPNE